MTKEEFKAVWDSDETGGGITNDVLRDCAYEWKLCRKRPSKMDIFSVIALVTRAAGTHDADNWTAYLPGRTDVPDCESARNGAMINTRTKRGGRTMPVSEAKKKANMRWQAKAMKRVPLDVRKEYFENVLSAIPEITGIGVNTFIKQAIVEKIQRDGLDLPTDEYKP